MRPTIKEVESLIARPGADRYAYFVHKSADNEVVWVLDRDGWALAETDDGVTVLAVWPFQTYAEQCTTGDWADFEADFIDLDEFLDEIIPALAERDMQVAVFPTPASQGVVVPAARLLRDLREELEKY